MWKSVINLMLCGVLLGLTVGATAEEGTLPNSSSKSMEWQMMPGESLNSLSRLFYPKSSAMQRLFVASSVKLNREQMPELTGNFKFGEYMIAKGHITQVQLEAALQRQQELARKGRYMWLGEILVEMNYVRPSQVQEALSVQKRNRK